MSRGMNDPTPDAFEHHLGCHSVEHRNNYMDTNQDCWFGVWRRLHVHVRFPWMFHVQKKDHVQIPC